MEGWRQGRPGSNAKPLIERKKKNRLDTHRPSHGRTWNLVRLKSGAAFAGGVNKAGTLCPDSRQGPVADQHMHFPSLPCVPNDWCGLCVHVNSVVFHGRSRRISSAWVWLTSLSTRMEYARLSDSGTAGRAADEQKLFLC